MIVAQREQFPLKVAFGLTIHKAQGMTLDRVIIDSTYISQPGQLSVGIGRVKTTNGLQINNFQEKHCIRPTAEVLQYNATPSKQLELNHECCRVFKEDLEKEVDQEIINIFREEESEFDNSDAEDEEMVAWVDFAEAQIDQNIDVDKLISECMFPEALTAIQTEINTFCTDEENKERIADFCKIIWNQINNLHQQEVKDNNQKSHTSFYTHVHEYQTSGLYERVCKHILFRKEDSLTRSESHLCFRITKQLTKLLLQMKAADCPTTEADQSKRNVHGTLTSGQVGKIRNVGGFAIAKVRKVLQKSENTISNSVDVTKRKKLHGIQQKLLCIDHITRSQYQIEIESQDKESLNAVKSKQNLRCGLTNITDQASDFFTKLCKENLSLMTFANLYKYEEDFASSTTKELLGNKELLQLWLSLYHDNVSLANNPILLTELFEDITLRFVKPIINQFRREYLVEINQEKKAAHRENIKMKRKKVEDYKEISFEQICEDSSPGRKYSHKILKSKLEKKELPSHITKDQLLRLCQAYSVKGMSNKNTKAQITEKLRNTVLSHEDMPNADTLPTSTVGAVKN